MQISVAVTTYNGDRFIEAQLDSILNQSRQPDEIILCDDNSSDNTFDIARRYQQQYPDIIDIHKNNATIGVRRNFAQCIKKCTGDWILLSDQDDVWKLNKIERQYEVAKLTEYPLVFHDSQITTKRLEPISTHFSEVNYSQRESQNIIDQISELIRSNFIKGCSIMFNSNIKEYILPIPEGWSHDYYIGIWAASLGGVYGIEEPLHLYRRHADQDSGRVDNSIVEDLYNGYNRVELQTLSTNSEQWHRLRQRVNNVNESELCVQKKKLLQIIDERIKYENRRIEIYDNESTLKRSIQALLENALSGRYSKFGTMPVPVYVLNDLYRCFMTSVTISR